MHRDSWGFAVKVQQTMDTNCPKGNPSQTEEKNYHCDRDKIVEQVSQKGWGIFNPDGPQDLTEEGPGQQTYLRRDVGPNGLEMSLQNCFIIV